MFENEYKMDIRRYQRWTTPIFYKVLSFWPWLFIFLLSTVGAIIFYKNDLPMRWKSLALMLMLISVYRSVLFRPMLAAWTVRSKEDSEKLERAYDLQIFEAFEP